MNKYILKLVILLIIFKFTVCDPVQWTAGNNHYYDLITSTDSDFTTAQSVCTGTNSGGNIGYVATITSFDEWNWILTQFPTAKKTWISGEYSSGQVKYNSGPESQLDSPVFYSSNQCSGFCNFASSNPQFKGSANIMINDDGSWENTVGAKGDFVLCEYGGLDSTATLTEIVVASPPTAGSTLSIKLYGSLVADTITLTPLSADAIAMDPLTPTDGVFTIPAGSGSYKASMNSESGDANPFIIAYQSPTVSMVQPVTETSDPITIQGSNFGESVDQISSIKINDIDCTPQSTTSNQVICQIGSIPTSYSKIQITVSGNTNPIYQQISIFDKTNVNLYLSSFDQDLSYTDNSGFIAGQSSVNDLVVYSSCISTEDQFNLLSLILNGDEKFWLESISFVNSTFLTKDGVEITCYSKTALTADSEYLVFDVSTQSVVSEDDPTKQYSSLVFYAPQPEITYTGDNPIQADTTGSSVEVSCSNCGSTISLVQSINDVVVSTSAFEGTTLQIPGGYKPYTVQFFSNGLLTSNSLQVTYNPPTVMSAHFNTDSLLVIEGGNFGNDSSVVSVDIGGIPCSNPQITVDSDKLTCNYAGGSSNGEYSITVTVYNQASDPTPISVPTLSGVVGCAIQSASITLTGFFGGSDPISATVDSNDCLIDDSSITNYQFACLLSGDATFTDYKAVAFFAGNNPSNSITVDCHGQPSVTGILPVSFTSSPDPVTITIAGANLLTPAVTITPAVAPSDGEPATYECTVNEELSTDTQIICAPGSYKLVDQDQLSVDTNGYNFSLTFSYTAISITSIVQTTNKNTITIAGDGFASDNTITPATVVDCAIIPNTANLQCTLAPEFISSEIEVSNTLTSDKMNFLVTPVINDIKLGASETQVLMNVSFFETETLGVENTITFALGTDPLTADYTNPAAISFDVADPEALYDLILTVSTLIDEVPYTRTNEHSFSLANPVINSIQSQNQDNSITISGYHFGSDASKITIQIGSITVLSTEITSVAETQIILDLSHNSYQAGQQTIVLDVEGLDSVTSTYLFTPVISSFSPAPLYNIAANLTLTGYGFSKDNLSVLVDGQALASTGFLFIDDTSIVIIDFQGTAEDKFPLSLTVLAGVASNEVTVSYVTPTVTSYTQDGVVLTLVVTNMGLVADISSIYVEEDVSLVCSSPQAVAETTDSVTCNLPTGATVPVSGAWIFKTAATFSTFDMVLTPVVTVDQTKLYQTIGEVFTFASFLFLDPTQTVLTDPNGNAIAMALDDTNQATFFVPASAGKDLTFTLSNNNTQDTKSTTFQLSYLPPTITQDVTTDAANVITVVGSNFVTNSSLITLPDGLSIKSIVQTENVNEFTVLIEAMKSVTSNQLIVTVAGQDTDEKEFSLSPSIDGVSPFPSTSGSDTQLSGSYLAFNAPTIYFDPTLSNNSTTQLVCKDNTGDKSTCTIPQGSGYFNLIVNSKSFKFQYAPPAISYVTYAYDPDSETAYVAIYGSNFGQSASQLSIMVDDNTCTSPKFGNSTKTGISCSYTTKSPVEGSATVVVVANTLTSGDATLEFTYPECSESCGEGGYCSYSLKCYCGSGYKLDSSTQTCVASNSKSSNGWKIAVGVLVPVFAIALTVAIVLYLRKRKSGSYERYSNRYFMELNE